MDDHTEKVWRNVIAQLNNALKQAILEVEEHNREYNHVTKETTIYWWKQLYGMTKNPLEQAMERKEAQCE